MSFAAPAVAEIAQTLELGVSAGLREDLQLLAFKGTFDAEDLDRRPVTKTLADRNRLVGVALACGLVPVRGGGVEGGLAVGVVFLDGGFKGFVEGDVGRYGPMPSIGALRVDVSARPVALLNSKIY